MADLSVSAGDGVWWSCVVELSLRGVDSSAAC